ncbi:MAG: MBL fold metallo-hydrolase [Gemmatimonadota bacterium]|nr:MBL fold metallo-hydrolase [Gemmatimonadota bacterium]
MSLTIRFWGTRGSVPSPGAHTVRYGGNTPCVEVRTRSRELLIFDAGTGIRELGLALEAEQNGDPITGQIVLSHAHWDHIQGLPFFGPLFRSGNRFTIWSAASLAGTVERAVREQMASGVFPVSFDEVASTVEFRAYVNGEHACPEYTIRSIEVRHPGGAIGYRLADSNTPGAALVYISDNELGESPSYASATGWREALVEFTRAARVLVHDAAYTAEEYEQHRGWGHSRADDVVALALDAGVSKLVLFHHRPGRSDDELDECVERCRAMARGAPLEIVAAAEGMELEI